MKHLSIMFLVALLMFTVGVFSESATNRAVEYLWPDIELPKLERATIVTINMDGYELFGLIGCTPEQIDRSLNSHRSLKKRPRR